MKYKQIDIFTDKDGLEVVLGALMGIDIVDAVVDDPDDIDDLLNKEHDYEWDYVDDKVLNLKNEQPKVTVYVTEDELAVPYSVQPADDSDDMNKLDAILFVLENAKGFGFDINIEVTDHDDSEWKDNWKEFFKPAKVSSKIIVKPTWEEYALSPDEQADGMHILEIDPGMAFGTGTHETTSLCIKSLEEYMQPGDKVLDVGTGSGILAIAASMLGASDVLGVEIDPVAVEIAQENIELNHVADTARAQYGDLTKGIDYKANVVVANLMADLVMMLSKDVSKHLLPGGYYISSGIIDEKLVTVADSIRSCGFKIMEVKNDGMWCAIVAKL